MNYFIYRYWSTLQLVVKCDTDMFIWRDYFHGYVDNLYYWLVFVPRLDCVPCASVIYRFSRRRKWPTVWRRFPKAKSRRTLLSFCERKMCPYINQMLFLPTAGIEAKPVGEINPMHNRLHHDCSQQVSNRIKNRYKCFFLNTNRFYYKYGYHLLFAIMRCGNLFS